MPLHWQPVGPHDAATYWRRRALVALAAALVLAEAALEKFGGDSVQETRRNAEAYLDTLRFR